MWSSLLGFQLSSSNYFKIMKILRIMNGLCPKASFSLKEQLQHYPFNVIPFAAPFSFTFTANKFSLLPYHNPVVILYI